MASAMAAAAAHSMPPFPLPVVPRVRPPPIPKGTPGPNTLPMPTDVVPSRKSVWADGQWRNPRSNSALQKQKVASRQLEKALQHEVRGMNIYAYRHIKTQQVVYSLTKNMENNKILKQLVFHGKKTVPAALRRDVWRPYFSIHFPKTPGGAAKGLRVYQELRELSLKRQLAPPKEMTITTEQDVERVKQRYDPLELDHAMNIESNSRAAKHRRLNLPVVGKRLPQQMLARRLMNQKASSVADVAAVLTRMGTLLTPQQQLGFREGRKKDKEVASSARATRRLADIREKEIQKAAQLDTREDYFLQLPGYPQLDESTRARLSIEYDGAGPNLTLIQKTARATEKEVGATRALVQALSEWDAQKEAAIVSVERNMMAEIDQELASMGEADRDKLSHDLDTERAEKQQALDAKITQTLQKIKQEREHLRASTANPPTPKEQRAIHKFNNVSMRSIPQMKKDGERDIRWSGPYARIAEAVEQTLESINQEWRGKVAHLEEEVAREQEGYADSKNHEVEIRWADIRDGTHASWPTSVLHAELEAKAVVKSIVRGEAEPHSMSNTIHVFGSDLPEQIDLKEPVWNRYTSPEDSAIRSAKQREQQIQRTAQHENDVVRDQILSMRRAASELEEHFANVELDPNTLISTSYCVDETERARSIVEGFKQVRRTAEDMRNIAFHLNYVRSTLPFAIEELESSQSSDADGARIEWLKLQVDLIELESNNLEAAAQATLRAEFDAKIDEREILETNARSEDIDVRSFAESDLERYNREFPLFAETEARIQSQVIQAITNTEKALQSVSDAGKDKLTQRLERLKVKQERLKEKPTDFVRGDEDAWADFVSKGGVNAYHPDYEPKAEVSTVHFVDRRATKPKPKTTWEKVKGIFGR